MFKPTKDNSYNLVSKQKNNDKTGILGKLLSLFGWDVNNQQPTAIMHDEIELSLEEIILNSITIVHSPRHAATEELQKPPTIPPRI